MNTYLQIEQLNQDVARKQHNYSQTLMQCQHLNKQVKAYLSVIFN